MREKGGGKGKEKMREGVLYQGSGRGKGKIQEGVKQMCEGQNREGGKGGRVSRISLAWLPNLETHR